MAYSIEKVLLEHCSIITDFDCGNDVLNDYLKTKALNDFDAVTYIVIDTNRNKIIAYFSISCGAIYHQISDEKIVHYPAVENNFIFYT